MGFRRGPATGALAAHLRSSGNGCGSPPSSGFANGMRPCSERDACLRDASRDAEIAGAGITATLSMIPTLCPQENLSWENCAGGFLGGPHGRQEGFHFQLQPLAVL